MVARYQTTYIAPYVKIKIANLSTQCLSSQKT